MSNIGKIFKSEVAVIIAAHGSPSSNDEIKAFFTSIRQGQAPSDEELNELTRRYNLIGNWKALNKVTYSQAQKLMEELQAKFGDAIQVSVGFKYIEPKLDRVFGDLISQKLIKSIICIIMSPYYTDPGSSGYLKMLSSYINCQDVKISFLDDFSTQFQFISLLENHLKTHLPSKDTKKALFLFSAHSLPEVNSNATQYHLERLALIERLKIRLKLNSAKVTYQSVGFRGGKWLGPDIRDVCASIDATSYEQVIVICDGFFSDNLEVFYDLDYDIKTILEKKGIEYYRVPLLNDSSYFIKMLCDICSPRIIPYIK